MIILTLLGRVYKTLTDNGPKRLCRTMSSLEQKVSEVADDSDLAHFLTSFDRYLNGKKLENLEKQSIARAQTRSTSEMTSNCPRPSGTVRLLKSQEFLKF